MGRQAGREEGRKEGKDRERRKNRKDIQEGQEVQGREERTERNKGKLRGKESPRKEGWIMLVKGSLKGGRVGIEREGQGRGGVVASVILGLREGLHGERRWTRVGPRRGVLGQEGRRAW